MVYDIIIQMMNINMIKKAISRKKQHYYFQGTINGVLSLFADIFPAFDNFLL